MTTYFQKIITNNELQYTSAVHRAIEVLKNEKAKALLPQLEAPTKDEVKLFEQHALNIKRNFKNIIVIATGASTINPRVITSLSNSTEKSFYFLDNIDPTTIKMLLNEIDLRDTAFIVISKSGTTLETLSLTLYIITYLQKQEIKDLSKSFYFITDPIDNILRKIANSLNATIIDHPLDIGGRFSSFSSVSLLVATVAGVNIDSFCLGMQDGVNAFLEHDSYAASGANFILTMLDQGKRNGVMMPYVDRLDNFTSWYSQMSAESLGKGGFGFTPIRAKGTLDQHSQLQLYLDGPNDKFFNIIGIDYNNHDKDLIIENQLLEDSDFAYLNHRSVHDIMMATEQGTIQSLIDLKKDLRVITLNNLDEYNLAMLMIQFTIETLIIAKVKAINPFDQPVVEHGKKITRKILQEQKYVG
jgi:glucose-6-phosphate isomerase